MDSLSTPSSILNNLNDLMFLTERYLTLIYAKTIVLQQDNARPHTQLKLSKKKIEELDEIELLPHPAHSPYLTPSDYFLFRFMVNFSTARTSKTICEFLMSKN